ncbi:MAG: zf-HC2 domain-containing protein [Candidatus Binatia bacterium]
MPLGSLPNCQDFQKRFDLFFDGEIDGRTMRSLALHVTRCRACEEELRQSECLQEVVAQTVQAEVDGIDVAVLWRSIEGGLESPRLSLLARARERWEFRSPVEMRFLGLAATVALLLIVASALWPSASGPVPVSVVNNKAQIDTLSSSASAVAVWTEPRQQTTAIWVASYEP